MPDTVTSSKSTFELINELIIAISHLMWPVIVFMIILLFRGELSDILKRLKKGKILGQELELDEKIDELENATHKASESVLQDDKYTQTYNDDVVGKILIKSAEDPKIGILLLSREIEKEVNTLLASMGLLSEIRVKTVKGAFQLLEEFNYIPKSIVQSLILFWNLRNKVIHGKEIEDESQLIRFIDIGATLLTSLKSIPHEKHFIHNTNIELYADANGQQKRLDVVGVILENINTESKAKHYQVFPVTKDYKIGDEVSWEWSFEKVWGQTWYKNQDTNEIVPAWFSSAEFTGRSIKDI